MTAEEFLNALNILESIDEVPGMPAEAPDTGNAKVNAALEEAYRENRMVSFRRDPIRFLRRADDATRSCIWAEVTPRMAGGV